MKKLTMDDLSDDQIGKLAIGLMQQHIDRESRTLALLTLADAMENQKMPQSFIAVDYVDYPADAKMELVFTLEVDSRDFTQAVLARACKANNLKMEATDE